MSAAFAGGGLTPGVFRECWQLCAGNDLEYRFDVAGVVACSLTLIVTRALLAAG